MFTNRRLCQSILLSLAMGWLTASSLYAVPVDWIIVGLEFSDGTTASGSYTYDVDTDTFSNVNVTSTTYGPYDIVQPSSPGNSGFLSFAVDPAGAGQPRLVAELSASMTNAGGTIAIIPRPPGFSFEGTDTGFGSITLERNIVAGYVTTYPGDACETATVVGEGVFPFDTAGAIDDGLGCGQQNRPIDEIWYAYTSTVTGDVDIYTASIGNGDSYIGVYDDCARTNTVACNDDCTNLTSGLRISVIAGTTYFIELGNFNSGRETAGMLAIQPVPSFSPSGPPTIWSGEDMIFIKADNTDGTDPANQDVITASVALSRNVGGGPIYNATASIGPTVCLNADPVGTAWAFGRAVDHQSLIFTDLIDLSGFNPPSLVGQELVLHIIEENVYLDIRFTSWSSGGAGGFSYERALPPDLCEGAVQVNEGIFAFDTAGATDDAQGCGSQNRPLDEIWYAYTATVTDDVDIYTASIGNGDSYLGVYDDCARTNSIACNDDCTGLTSGFRIQVNAGTTYLIELGNFDLGDETAGLLAIQPVRSFSPLGPASIWSGEDIAFIKADNTDGNDPANQDVITASVALSRNVGGGPIYNAAVSIGPTDCLNEDPLGTEWAFGRAVDYQALSFTDLVELSGFNPSSLVGQDVVLHIIEENIYLDIRFTSWSSGGAGGFSYERAVDPNGCLKGDANGDLVVDVADITRFYEVLLAPEDATFPEQCAVDVNGDERADGLDIQAFAGLLLTP